MLPKYQILHSNPLPNVHLKGGRAVISKSTIGSDSLVVIQCICGKKKSGIETKAESGPVSNSLKCAHTLDFYSIVCEAQKTSLCLEKPTSNVHIKTENTFLPFFFIDVQKKKYYHL